MPIYEFFCSRCNTVFNFFSRSINTTKTPSCPKCGKEKLERMVSQFSMVKGERESGGDDLSGIDEGKMEKAMHMLYREASNIDENNPRQIASLMRKLSDATGENLGEGMEEALKRLEAGEDPDKIEDEMGDLLETDDAFEPKKKTRKKRGKIVYDQKLYEL